MIRARAIAAVLMLALFTLFAAALPAQTPEYPRVQTSVEPTSGTVGEHFHLNVSATVPNVKDLQVLPLFDIQTSWTVVGNPVVTDLQTGNEQTRQFRYTIVPFETGRQAVPQIAFTYVAASGTSNTAHSKPLWVEVNSVLSGNGSASALRDVKPPVPLPIPAAVYWTGGIIISLLIALLAWWLWRRYSQRLKKLIGRTLTPPEIAMKQMAALESERLIEHKKIKEYYTRLTDTMRHYLESAFDVQAMDLTSNELLRALDEIAEGESPHRMEDYRKAMARLAELMDEADLVKFARFIPEASRCRKALQSGRDIVTFTRYRFETDEEAATSNINAQAPPPPAPPVRPIAPPPLPSEAQR